MPSGAALAISGNILLINLFGIPGFSMADQQIDIEEWVDLMAQVLELPLEPEHRPGVIANLQRTATIAQLVMEFPLPNDVEAAAVFQP